MASLKIIRPPLCADPAEEVPENLWPALIEERRRFCREKLPSDCRLLLFFVEDAARSKWLGFGNRERYLKEALELNPEMVELALRGLTITRPDVVIDFDTAVVLGKHGRPKKGEGKPVGNRLMYGSTNAPYLLARLNRDRPDLAERVRAGELSANAAAIEAGFRKRPSALEQIRKLLPRLTLEERATLAGELSN